MEKPVMNKQQIIDNLKLLGEELEALHLSQPVCLLMIGGAYMITQFGNRTQTEDVDVFTRLDKYTEDYRRFRSAIHFIANDAHVSQKWVSDNIGDFMQLVGPIPEGTLWLKNGLLEIYIPEPQYILVLKLLAGRDKDIEDIQVLLRYLRLRERKRVEGLLQKYVEEQMLIDEQEKLDTLLSNLFKG